MGTIGYDLVDLKFDRKQEFSFCDTPPWLWTSTDLLFVLAAWIPGTNFLLLFCNFPERFLETAATVAAAAVAVAVAAAAAVAAVAVAVAESISLINRSLVVSSSQLLMQRGRTCITVVFLSSLFRSRWSSVDNDLSPFLLLVLLSVCIDSSAQQTARPVLFCSSGRLGSRNCGFRTKKSAASLFVLKVGGISMIIGKKIPRKIITYNCQQEIGLLLERKCLDQAEENSIMDYPIEEVHMHKLRRLLKCYEISPKFSKNEHLLLRTDSAEILIGLEFVIHASGPYKKWGE